MPKESLSVYLAAVDGMSPVLVSITDKTKALDKESQQLEQTFEALQQANKGLIERKTALQKQLQEVNEEVKEARKQFKALGDEANSDAYEKAQEKQQRLRDEIAATTKSLQENQKRYKENIEIIRKGGLEAKDTTLKKTAEGLAVGQVGQMVSSALGGLAQVWLTSSMGTPAASRTSDTISGLISGATAGAVAGLPGIIIGGIAGAASGALSGNTKIYEEQDNAFKEYYTGLRDQFSGLAAENVSSGSSIAAGRETDLISFSTMFGSQDAAEEYPRDLVDMSNRTPFLYDDLTGMSKTLATYGYNETNILPVLQTIGDAGAALGQSTGDMTSVATAIGRMVSSDKASLEYLNILNDRGINAVGYLAQARGRSVAQTYEDISKGNIKGTDAAEIILAAMEESYAGSMEAQSKTFAGLTSTLEGLQQEIENAAGEGYNSLRTDAVQTEIDSLGGALGDAMKEINTIIGENRAYLENLSEQYQRDALNALFTGEISDLFNEDQAEKLSEIHAAYEEALAEYEAGDQEAGLKLQSLYELTQETAQGYYESSDIMQAKTDTEIDHLAAIRENTAGLASAMGAFRLSEERSKGRAATYAFSQTAFSTVAQKNMSRPSAHAFGLERVPYNDYPALLHEGERVLTAREARAMDLENSLTAGLNGPDYDSLPPLPLVSAPAPAAGADAQNTDYGAPIYNINISGVTINGTVEDAADQLVEIIVRNLEQAAIIHQPG